MQSPAPVRLLLLEDEPVSARFLHDALVALPAVVDHATTLAAASALAGAGHALWLFDARLPDGHSADLLAKLRARGLAIPAIALSADVGEVSMRRLRSAGFERVIGKPVSGATLRATVRRYLPVSGSTSPDWDDDAAEAALGSPAAVAALRRLFLDELPEQRRRIRAACLGGEATLVRDQLHRLTSGCAFVGAVALLEAVRALASAPGDGEALANFELRAGALAEG
jgi:DNA-binding response OmpR family regulator